MSEQPQKTSLLSQMRENWFLVLFVGGLIVSWANMNNRVAIAESKIEKQEVSMALQASAINTMNISLAKIEASVTYLVDISKRNGQ